MRVDIPFIQKPFFSLDNDSHCSRISYVIRPTEFYRISGLRTSGTYSRKISILGKVLCILGKQTKSVTYLTANNAY